MERKLKLIWDFKGPNAAQTAAHHVIHLNEFIERDHINSLGTGTQQISDMHHIAFLGILESAMPPVRDALKPHRGQLWID